MCLKVPKCEIFDLFGPEVSIGRDKNIFFFGARYVSFYLCWRMRIAQCTLATIFEFELSQKKLFEVHLNVTKLLLRLGGSRP